MDHCPQLAEVNAMRNFQRSQNSSWQPQQASQNQWSQNQGQPSWQPQQPRHQQWQQQGPSSSWQNQPSYQQCQEPEQQTQWQPNIGLNQFRRAQAPPGFKQDVAPALPSPNVPLLEYKPQQEDSSFKELKRMYEEQQKEMAQLKTYLKTMEVQVGQIAQDTNRWQQGNLPSDTVSTSRDKDQCNAVALRSGRQIQPIVPPLLKGTRTSQECRDEEEDVEEVYSDPEPSSPRQPVITYQEEVTHPSRPETEGVQPR